ncbi:MAG: hypothetical protein QE285_08435 [Aquabacterium sp.]|nr:hypothetical protein [Aquabacterium sp.]
MTATRDLIAAIALTAAAAAGSAFAQEATPDTWLHSAKSTASGADVSADLQAARQPGLTRAWSAGYIEPVRNPALRAEVQARTLQAIQSGGLKVINSEVFSNTQASSTRLTRASS